MKVLYINWAPIWMGAEVGGGVNIYQQTMAVAMVNRGYEIYSLSAGYAYNFAGDIYLRRGADYKGTINYEIVNAPNVAPGFFNFSTPLADVAEQKVEEIFRRFLTDIKPDIVHFNNIEGFSANCLTITKQQNIKTVFSLHNYHPICNQVYLLYQDKEICLDFQQGARCLSCINPPSKQAELRKRKLTYHFHLFPEGHILWIPLRFAIKTAKSIVLSLKVLKSIITSYRERKNNQAKPITQLMPSQEISFNNDELKQVAGLPYQERRDEIIAILNQTDLLLSVSSWVKKVYIDMGIDEYRIKTCHIGSKIADLTPTYQPKRRQMNEAINVVFMGISSLPKGLPFFLNSLFEMDNGLLAKIKLHIYARGINTLSHLLEPLSRRLGLLVIQDGYHYQDIPMILRKMDVGIVPPIWWDNAPQVVFEMLAMTVPVIGAKIGGIPDFVRHGENGLLFEPGDTHDLINQLTIVLLDPSLIERLRQGITPMKTIAEHTDELENFYQKLV